MIPLPPAPIDQHLQTIVEQLGSKSQLLLHAPPGAGKTTRVPLALRDQPFLKGKRILMLEPRRIAAIGAAEFMSSMLGEGVGGVVGYRTREATKVSPRTCIEVVTEGVLTRILQSSPELPDIGVVIFDEFHERSIHSDLGLALCLEVQEALSPELRIVVMSATLQLEKLHHLMPHAALVSSPGRSYPIDIRYGPPDNQLRFEENIVSLVTRALRETEGDMLVFLPGRAEILAVEEKLKGRSHGVGAPCAILPLASEFGLEAQRQALAPASPGVRKIILATNIAETSITIDGLRVVVDSGVMRVPRMDPGRGMSGLVTIPISQASASQRAGRAGRQAPGIAYRMWSEVSHGQLPPFAPPEILTSDLVPCVLELAGWGASSPDTVRFVDPPPKQAFEDAQRVLQSLRALDHNNQITTHGREIVRIGVHPRLGHMILRARELGAAWSGCLLAALLEERDPLRGRQHDIDIGTRWTLFEDLLQGRTIPVKREPFERILRTAERLARRTGCQVREHVGEAPIGRLVAIAFPDFIAQRRDPSGRGYLLANGVGAILPDTSLLARHEYLAVAVVDGAKTNARILLAEPLSELDIRSEYGASISVAYEGGWDEDAETIRGFAREKLGALVLTKKPHPVSGETAAAAFLELVMKRGIGVLTWSREAASLRERVEWMRARLSRLEAPSLLEGALAQTVKEWLAPFLPGIRSLEELQKLDLELALRSYVPMETLERIEREAPAFIVLPSGTKAWIEYGPSPSISVKIQELFGSTSTPTIGPRREQLIVKLLSPANRPIQVTSDLESFWDTVYPKLRNEYRLKYPKHYWPEDPRASQPTRGLRPRR